jgi:hypothetical protein
MSQKKIVSVLKSLGIKARAFLAGVNVAQGGELVGDFNRSGPDTVQVLVCRYSLLQYRLPRKRAQLFSTQPPLYRFERSLKPPLQGSLTRLFCGEILTINNKSRVTSQLPPIRC